MTPSPQLQRPSSIAKSIEPSHAAAQSLRLATLCADDSGKTPRSIAAALSEERTSKQPASASAELGADAPSAMGCPGTPLSLAHSAG